MLHRSNRTDFSGAAKPGDFNPSWEVGHFRSERPLHPHPQEKLLALLTALTTDDLVARLQELVKHQGCADLALWLREDDQEPVRWGLQFACGQFREPTFQTLRQPRPGLRPEIALCGDGLALWVPMAFSGRWVGSAAFGFPRTRALPATVAAQLGALTHFTMAAWLNTRAYQKTRRLSLTDPLTQLGNRRALSQHLVRELARAQRFGHPFTLLMVDVDHFKGYNDRMGHLGGDEALQSIAGTLGDSLRQTDLVCRFGGEEFCAVLAGSDETSGREVADKLRDAVRSLTLAGAPLQPGGHLTISIGLSVCPLHVAAAHPRAQHELLNMADQALYEAKQRGRDRTVSYSEIPRRHVPPFPHEIASFIKGDSYANARCATIPQAAGWRMESTRGGSAHVQPEEQRICVSHH